MHSFCTGEECVAHCSTGGERAATSGAHTGTPPCPLCTAVRFSCSQADEEKATQVSTKPTDKDDDEANDGEWPSHIRRTEAHSVTLTLAACNSRYTVLQVALRALVLQTLQPAARALAAAHDSTALTEAELAVAEQANWQTQGHSMMGRELWKDEQLWRVTGWRAAPQHRPRRTSAAAVIARLTHALWQAAAASHDQRRRRCVGRERSSGMIEHGDM